ncbi:MAG: glycoside hydrolase family 9 protein [Chitinispirillales bacterium]|nr:glycoside hydrolase family 9 protein [Chitinispirillales bacterium]
MNVKSPFFMMAAAMTYAVLLTSASAQAQSVTGNIVIDQFGYREQAKKIAILRAPQLGPDAPVPSAYTPGAELQVVNVETGEAMFTGAPVPFRGGQTDAASGDRIWHFDFSALTSPGRYYILDAANNVRSYSFNIADGVYNNVLRAAVRTFYYQRAGIAKVTPYADPAWTDAMNFEQDRQTRCFFRQNDASTERDLSGGWFDAGDYNKYTKWTADYISEMILMYEENPSAFTDDFGIPESGNGIPDIIDEAMWGLDWLLRMQNEDGSVLSVQGLDNGNYNEGTGSPPSRLTGRSFYGPANATATFGAARAYALAARFFRDRDGETDYVNRLTAAAIGAWEWGFANPDSIFHNNCGQPWNAHLCPGVNTVGLAAGDQEIVDNTWQSGAHVGRTTGRLENMLTAAWFLFELTEDENLLTFVEDSLTQFPLFQPAWGGPGFMDHYRHTSHLLYMRYINHPRACPELASAIRSALITGMTRNGNFNAPNAYATSGYRAFVADYNWGSNKAKNDYGMTFYLWNSQVDPSVNAQEFRSMAEGYLHYIHGVNPFNWVYLTNMGRYGAARSQRTLYHTWFGEGTQWSVVTDANPGPAPGFMPGGPNSRYAWDDCCNTTCGWIGNDQRCQLVDIPDRDVTPPMKMYVETNVGWPINSWEITENMNAYQLSYIRLLSKFVDWSSESTVSVRRGTPSSNTRNIGIQYRRIRGGVELRVKENAEVKIFALNGVVVGRHNFTGGMHNVSLARLPKGIYIMKMVVDGERVVLRMPNTM